MALPRLPPEFPSVPGLETPPEDAASRFSRAGFLNAEAAREIWNELFRVLPAGNPLRESLGEVWSALGRASDPDLALTRFSRWVEADLTEGGGPAGGARAARFGASPAYRQAFVLLAGTSPALAEELERSWEELAPERWLKGWETPESLERRLRPMAALTNPLSGGDAFAAAARRFRRVEELRIAFLDEFRQLPVEAVTLQISWLADSLIAASLARAWEEVGKKFGLPAAAPGETRRGFAVLALGKLGSLELNYSSDIDLLFLSDERALPPVSPELKEALLRRLGERLLQLLDQFTDDGQLYRVDTRLRPGGGSGRLVWSAPAALAYYHSEGRTWERQALLRLRPVAGDLELARSFCAELDPFIFRKSLSGEEIDELRGLKAQIERLAAERGESDVKIGRGGIRDVEYIVQYLQLLHGAAVPQLKDPNIFRLLEALEAHRLLNADETDSLRRGYRFLRQVEHRIQLNYLRQTHRLPDDPRDLRRIARGLGHEGVESFRERLAASSARIRRVYQRLFQSAAPPAEEEERLAMLLDLPLETVTAAARDYLAPFGFSDPEEALRKLRRLAGEEGAAWDQARLREAFKKIAPRLLREMSQYPDPDRTLANFHDCALTLGARSVFYQLLAESEKALLLILEICGRSTYAIEVLRNYPGLFDEVIDAILTGYSFERESLSRAAGAIVREAPDPTAALFELKYLQFLLIAFLDLDRSLNLMAVMRHLAGVADAVLEAALRLAEKDLVARAPGETLPPFLVLALGKLGGEELNYRSDLDLVFLYRSPEGGDLPEAALTQERAHRLAQAVLNRLGERDGLGPLFKADVRLRPMGSKNLLAVSLDELRRYFREGTGQTWERQAFLRARAVVGDPALAGEALDFIREAMPLRQEEDREAVLGDVAKMRRRLEDAAGPGEFLKRGRGGIVDVEFIAQTLELLHGRERPGVLSPNTPSAIDRLAKEDLLSPAAAADLLTSYQFLRWLETRLSLLIAPEENLSGLDRDRLRSLIHRIGYRSTGEVAAEEIFEEELSYHRKKNREHLERVLGRRV